MEIRNASLDADAATPLGGFQGHAINNTMWKFTWQSFSTTRLPPLYPSTILSIIACQIIRHVCENFHLLLLTLISYLQSESLASHPNVVLNRTFIVDLARIQVSYWPIDHGP